MEISKQPIKLNDSNEDNGAAGGEIESARRDDDDDGVIIYRDPDNALEPSADDKEDKAIEADGTPQTPLNSRQTREMKHLGRWFNPAATEMSTRSMHKSTVIDRDSQSGSDTLTTTDTQEHASILIDRHHPALIPDMAFLMKEGNENDHTKFIKPKKYGNA
jgi:hypothetical protein